MACLNPYIITRDPYDTYYKSGKPKVKFIGKFNADTDLQDLKDGIIQMIPCGKCINCRLDYARSWSDRMVLEYLSTNKALFLTLTYNEKTVPRVYDEENRIFMTLVKKHVSTFMKDLRGRKEFIGKTIRFFAAGEYGDKTHRPHYHLILFGVDLNDLRSFSNVIPHGHNELKQIYYDSELMDDIWEKGFTLVADATYETFNYVARYTLKKAQGTEWTKEVPEIQKEFTLMSRRPGIGAGFLEDPNYFGRLAITDTLCFKGKIIYWPKYIQKKYWFKQNTIEHLDELGYATHIPIDSFHEVYFKKKKKKADLVTKNIVSKFENDSRSYEEIMEAERTYREASASKLKRSDML